MAYNRKSKKWPHLWILLLGAMLLAVLSAGSIARYTHLESKEEEGNSQQFYFASNYLTEDGKTYTLSENTTSLNIELRNYEDALRWSDGDIFYTYNIKKDGTEIKATDNQNIKSKKNQGNKSEISISNMSAGIYDVTATTVKPFEKTLKGKFIVPKKEDQIFYEVSDSSGSPYVLLTVSTKMYEGNITINWPENVIPDSTEAVFQSCNTWENDKYNAGNVTTQVTKYSSYTYQFFKVDTKKNYSKNEITVVKAQ